MKPEYIEWAKQGIKTATTRTKDKGTGEFEFISGSRYKPIKSGVVVNIDEVFEWTPATITAEQQARILKAENFQTWGAFICVLAALNLRPILPSDHLFTHFWPPLLSEDKEAISGKSGE